TPTPEPVIAAFGYAPVEGQPLTVQFTNQSGGPVASFAWDFGDNVGTSSEPNPVYTYAAGGDYNVTLTVTAADGVTTNSITQVVSVVAPTPTTETGRGRVGDAAVARQPRTGQLTNQSGGPVARRAWDVGAQVGSRSA